MKIKRQIILEEPMEIKFSEITLLSESEYKDNRDLISTLSDWWWLRSPHVRRSYLSAYVDNYGWVYSDYVGNSDGARPALRIRNPESSDLKSGDKLIIAGKTWTVLNGGLALCDEIIGNSSFRKDWETPDANVYEKSDIKKYIENWAKENGIEMEGN